MYLRREKRTIIKMKNVFLAIGTAVLVIEVLAQIAVPGSHSHIDFFKYVLFPYFAYALIDGLEKLNEK